MNTCETCRWWEKVNEWGRCNRATDESRQHNEILFYVFATSLLTSEHFGCNQHQPKEALPTAPSSPSLPL